MEVEVAHQIGRQLDDRKDVRFSSKFKVVSCFHHFHGTFFLYTRIVRNFITHGFLLEKFPDLSNYFFVFLFFFFEYSWYFLVTFVNNISYAVNYNKSISICNVLSLFILWDRSFFGAYCFSALGKKSMCFQFCTSFS